jgi:hypothetical protein
MANETKSRLPFPLLVRCLLEQNGNYWQAFSLEFGLAVQANTKQEAKRKLEIMIYSYLFDALVGEDRDHAEELLRRRATPSVYVKYYACKAIGAIESLIGRGRHNGNQGNCIYNEPVPLTPAACPAE